MENENDWGLGQPLKNVGIQCPERLAPALNASTITESILDALIIDVRENRVKIGDKRQIEHRSLETPKLKPNPSTKIQSYWKPKNSL